MQSLTSRLDRLTNDMQVMMASGSSFSIVPDEVDLLTLIDDCRWELDPIAQGLGVGIEITTFGDRSWQLWADAVRLKQIILNLLENAVRYGSVGSTVAVRLRQSRDWLLFVVENDIAQQQHQVPTEWMQPFVRGEPANDVYPRGLGIGLVIVRELVDAHQGHLITRVRNRSIAFGVRLPRG
jgi:signal transduction histidine kinase